MASPVLSCKRSANDQNASSLWRPRKRRSLGGRMSFALYVWGGSEGNGDGQDKPVFMEKLSNHGVKHIGCGRAAGSRAFMLTTSGELKEWDSTNEGWYQAKEQDSDSSVDSPRAILPTKIDEMSCGFNHFAAVAANGDLYTWGGGAFGELGHNEEKDEPSPRKVHALSGKKVKQVVCGDYHTVALTADGKAFSWGSNTAGRTGHGEDEGYQLVPRPLQGLGDVQLSWVSTGSAHTAAVTETGSLYTWGFGKNGELGHAVAECRSDPTIVSALKDVNVVKASCGSNHTGAITQEGQLYTFGGNKHGKLGLGDKVKRLAPALVDALNGSYVKDISCGMAHSVAATSAGEIYTWGAGGKGQLGHGSTETILSPAKVEKLKDCRVVRVAAFGDYTVALVEPSSLPPDDIPVMSVLHSMIDDKEHADVTFLVENKPVYAHRAILVRRCKMFGNMFRLGMQTQDPIPIPDVRREIFLKVLEFLYTGIVDVEIEHIVELYATANKYDLTRLQDKCANLLQQQLTPDKAGLMLRKAADSNFPELKRICMKFVVENLALVSKTDGLKDAHQTLLLEIIQGASCLT